MERYLRYVVNIAAGADDTPLQPVYRINGDAAWSSRSSNRCAVIAGWDRCGSAMMRTGRFSTMSMGRGAGRHARVSMRGLRNRAMRRCSSGSKCWPAAIAFMTARCGIWEYRGRARRPHVLVGDVLGRLRSTGTDRHQLGFAERAVHWSAAAARIARFIHENCYDATRNTYVGAVGAPGLDASLLRLADVGFLQPTIRVSRNRCCDRAAS